MAPHSSTLAWRIPGRRSLVGYSPWGCKESDMTERLPFHFSLSCVGEGNGNPLQCSCLENPRDGGAWWAAVYGVAQSWTRLTQLSGSSSSSIPVIDHDADFLLIDAASRWLSGKESTCHAGDVGLIPGSGRSPGGGHGNPPQYSCLENPKDRGGLQSIGS